MQYNGAELLTNDIGIYNGAEFGQNSGFILSMALWEPRPQELEIKIQPMGFLPYLSQEIRILGQVFFFNPENRGYRGVAQEQQWPLRYKIGIKILEKHM